MRFTLDQPRAHDGQTTIMAVSSFQQAAETVAAQIPQPYQPSRNGGRMIRVCRQTELAVRPEDESVAVPDALEILAARGIDVIAHSLYADWNGMVLLVVAEDVRRAKRVLETTGFK